MFRDAVGCAEVVVGDCRESGETAKDKCSNSIGDVSVNIVVAIL